MTAWHDQPPASRRHVRQTERDAIVDPQVTPEENAPEDSSFASLARLGWEAEARRASAAEGPPASRAEVAIASGRRVQQAAPDESTSPSERSGQSERSGPEPLPYIAQARPQIPSYDGASFRGRSISDVPQGSESAASARQEQIPTLAGSQPEQPAALEQPAYRRRDFSPDASQSALRRVGPQLNWAPPTVIPLPEKPPIAAIETVSPPLVHAEVLPPEPSRAANQTGEAFVRDAPTAEPVLTRRQMREQGIGGFAAAPSKPNDAEFAGTAPDAPLDHAASAQTAPALTAPDQTVPGLQSPLDEAQADEVPIEVAPVAAAPDVAVVEIPAERPRFRDRARRATVDPEADHRAQLAAEADTRAFAVPAVVEPPALVEPPARPPFTGAIPTEITVAEIVEAPPVRVTYDSPVELVSTPVIKFDSAAEPEIAEPEVVVAEIEPHLDEATAFDDLLFPGGQPGDGTVETAAADAVPTTFDAFLAPQGEPAPSASNDSYVPPVGHWSTQADIDDGEQVQENTFARDVGATSGALTTSALVLPSMPTGEDIMGPLSGTGEILITGSINLPSSIGSTGVHPARYDHSDVDALLEADDREDSDPESAPVRAIRAISTNTGSGDVINSMKPQKTSRLPLILIVSAAVMAVGVIVLLVAGLIFKIF